MKIGDLYAEISIKGGGTAIASLKGVATSSLAAKAGIAGAILAMNEFTKSVRDNAVFLDKYERLTGRSGDELQLFAYKAAQANVAAEDVANTITTLRENSSKIALGEPMHRAYALLDISPREDPIAILQKLGKEMHKFNAIDLKVITEGLGLSDDMFYFLQRGIDSFDELDKKYVLTKEQRAQMIKLNSEWAKFWYQIKQIGYQFATLSAEFHTGLLTTFLNATKAILDFAKWLSDAMQKSTALKYAISAIGAAITAYFAPWLLIATGIALVLDDIWTFFQGGDSVTGVIVNWVKESKFLLSIFEALWETLKGIWDLIKLSAKGWKMIFEATGLDKFFGNILSDIQQPSNLGEMATPQPATAATSSNVNNNQKQTINVYTQGGDNPRQTGNIVADEVSRAVFQSPALAFGGGR